MWLQVARGVVSNVVVRVQNVVLLLIHLLSKLRPKTLLPLLALLRLNSTQNRSHLSLCLILRKTYHFFRGMVQDELVQVPYRLDLPFEFRSILDH